MMQLMRTSHNAFIVSMLLNMEKQPAENIKSIELHGTTIKYNPEYIQGLSDNDLKFNLMHECWHLPFFDQIRAKGKDDPKVWNDACDQYINNMIRQDSGCGVKVPDSANCDSKYAGKEKDEIYELLLLEAQKQNQQNQDPMSGDLGGSSSEGDQGVDGDGGQDPNQPGQSNTPGQTEQQLQEQIQNMVQQAAMQAKSAGGHVPQSVNQWMEELYNPKLNWEQLLLKYMDSFRMEDYTYQRLNRKMFPHGFLLPTLFSEGLGNIVIANDESGSVSDKEYQTYLGAIKDIKDKLNPTRIDVLNFTTKVVSHHVVEQDEDISKIQFRGCGGTHIPCVFNYIKAEKMKPQVLILFSDMESQMPTEKPPYDVIWIAVNDAKFKPPFGKAIHVKI